MADKPLQSIIYPTDFSPVAVDAFAHAVRLAAASRGLLHVLHVQEAGEAGDFPHVRELLAQWGMIAPGASRAQMAEQLGVNVVEAVIEAKDIAPGLRSYIARQPCDLVVLMTHGRHGLQRWLQASVAEATAEQSKTPTLFLREGQRGFIDRDSGAVLLRTVLLPIDPAVAPMRAWRLAADLAHLLEPSIELRLLHIGEKTPIFSGLLPHIDLRSGPVVETILGYARQIGADLIVMPTAGHHGVFDALRGSTTERVLREAHCPVLAVPAD